MAKANKTKEGQEEEKKSKLDKAFEKLNTAYGKGTVIVGDQKTVDVDVVSTGSIGLDAAIGIGGLPLGRIVEVIAPESAGKTTLCIHIIANAQKLGYKCAYIDMEHHLSSKYMTDLGVNMSQLILSQPGNGEMALEIANELIKSNEIRVCIIDSVAALVPKAEGDGSIGDVSVSRHARLMSQACRILNPIVEINNCLVIFTNQIRANVGGMGNPEVPTGGNALKFFASVRLDMRRIKNDKQEELSRTKIKVIKNKMSVPFKEIEVDVIWGQGFGKLGEIVDLAEELKMIVLSGSWYKWPGKDGASIAQGRNAMIQMLEDNPEMKEEWETRIISVLKGEVVLEEVTDKLKVS